MKIAPGIADNPPTRLFRAHGKLYGCNKAGGGAQFTATFVMTQATCSNLSMSGVAQFEWADGGHSTVFLAYHPQAERTEEAVRERLDHRRAMFQGLDRERVGALHRGLQRQRRQLQRRQPAEADQVLEHAELPAADAEHHEHHDATGHDPTTTPNTPPATVPDTNPGTVPVDRDAAAR